MTPIEVYFTDYIGYWIPVGLLLIVISCYGMGFIHGKIHERIVRRRKHNIRKRKDGEYAHI